MTRLEDVVAELVPLLERPGAETSGLLQELKLLIGREYHTDPVFHARVRLVENLMHVLKPGDIREAAAFMVGILPIADELTGRWVAGKKPQPPTYGKLTLDNVDVVSTGFSDSIHEYAARLTAERAAILEDLCRQSLEDPHRRGVLIVRDPETGVETMTLDASVPHCTIHDYPHGRNVVPKRPTQSAPAQREEHHE